MKQIVLHTRDHVYSTAIANLYASGGKFYKILRRDSKLPIQISFDLFEREKKANEIAAAQTELAKFVLPFHGVGELSSMTQRDGGEMRNLFFERNVLVFDYANADDRTFFEDAVRTNHILAGIEERFRRYGIDVRAANVIGEGRDDEDFGLLHIGDIHMNQPLRNVGDLYLAHLEQFEKFTQAVTALCGGRNAVPSLMQLPGAVDETQLLIGFAGEAYTLQFSIRNGIGSIAIHSSSEPQATLAFNADGKITGATRGKVKAPPTLDDAEGVLANLLFR